MIFPLAVPVLHVLLNGLAVQSYRPALVDRGRVLAPLPMLEVMTATAQIDGAHVLARRGDRFAQAQIREGYVEIGPLLRALGAVVRYDAHARELFIVMAPQPLATATPFNRAVPQPAPRNIFTPMPSATPKPVVTGKPAPRRTPQSVIVSAPETPPPVPRRP